jgi:aminoglycoside/choline kinase family phosphotransferase
MWEFAFSGVWDRSEAGKPMCADVTCLSERIRKIAELLAGQPRVFVHRDYHSRNLMVDGERLRSSTFKDALMGPAYDLASLLRDAYIELDEALIDRLINRFSIGWRRIGRCGPTEAFRRLFDFTSIQRNLKAAGRFCLHRSRQRQSQVSSPTFRVS